MRRFPLISLRLGTAFLASLLPASLWANPLVLRASLEHLSRRAPAPSAGVSIEIADLETGEPVFQRNPQSPETIASLTKLFSTAAALHYLGPDYKFRTTFWRRGDIQQGTLLGSLLVVGRGDPNISGRFYNDDINAIFDQWAAGLRKVGVTRVAGDLILNDTFFDSVLRHPDWPRAGETKWYQAPISALSYNDNVVLVAIRPGPRAGRPAAVALEPPTELLQAVSHARTVNRRGRVRVAVNRQAGSNAVTVFGTVPLRGVWWSTPIAIDNPPAFFGDVLKSRLQNAGIEITGGVVEEDVVPDDAWALVAQTESDLVPTLAVTNKKSQGFYAEQVFKTLGAEKTGKGSWEAAVSVEKSFLAELGLDPARFELHDGSGLSPENRVSAADIVAFLRAMNAHPNGPVWKSTLAVSGDPEGTLRHRLSDRLVAGKVIAKTGSISGVSTLAGYVTAVSGRTYAFAILLNGRRVYDTSGHAFQDRLLRALVKNG